MFFFQLPHSQTRTKGFCPPVDGWNPKQPPGIFFSNPVNNRISTTVPSTGECTGFLNHQQSQWDFLNPWEVFSFAIFLDVFSKRWRPLCRQDFSFAKMLWTEPCRVEGAPIWQLLCGCGYSLGMDEMMDRILNGNLVGRKHFFQFFDYTNSSNSPWNRNECCGVDESTASFVKAQWGAVNHNVPCINPSYWEHGQQRRIGWSYFKPQCAGKMLIYVWCFISECLKDLNRKFGHDLRRSGRFMKQNPKKESFHDSKWLSSVIPGETVDLQSEFFDRRPHFPDDFFSFCANWL